MFWSLTRVTLVKDRLNSSGRLGLLILDAFLSHESLRLTNGFWSVWCLSRKNISSFLWRASGRSAGGCLISVFLLFWLFSISWYLILLISRVLLIFYCLSCVHIPFYPQNATKRFAWWTHLLPPVQRISFFTLGSYCCLLSLIHCYPGPGIFPDIWIYIAVSIKLHQCVQISWACCFIILNISPQSKIKQYIRVDIYRCAQSSRY